MYEYFNGKLVDIADTYVVVDVNGVGYKIPIPASHFAKLPAVHSSIQLYISFIVREASQAIFGFLSRQERDFFELLITISGIGPKTALALIGHLSFSELESAIQTENLTLLSKVPGIGKKTAERLVIELRNKISSFCPDPSQAPASNQMVKDALNALLNLGYQHSVAHQAIKNALSNLPSDTDLTSLLSLSIRLASIHSKS